MGEYVLVTTLGAAPQVVTLAADALGHQGVVLRRVIVLHTDASQPPVRDWLAQVEAAFVGDDHYPAHLLYVPHLLAGDNGPLHDLTSRQQIDAAFQSVYTLLRHHKQAGAVLHLCPAGGRKTMTMFVLAAAQLVMDDRDRVWHLVSEPDLMRSGAMHTTDPNTVHLVPVPLADWSFVRKREHASAARFLESLTPAEKELTELLLAEGLSNEALAQRLHKSSKTVANQLSVIYDKLAVHYTLERHPDRTLLLALLGRSS